MVEFRYPTEALELLRDRAAMLYMVSGGCSVAASPMRPREYAYKRSLRSWCAGDCCPWEGSEGLEHFDARAHHPWKPRVSTWVCNGREKPEVH